MRKIMDTHIHLDKYNDEEISEILSEVDALVSVSMNLESCKRNYSLAKIHPTIRPAFGWHPEQELPSDEKLAQLFSWIQETKDESVAIGEVGLPYYLRENNKLAQSYAQYIEVLESFIKLAVRLDKPIALHAVYDDAHIVCDLLEKHTVKKAHFHWFKGDKKTVERLKTNKYHISVTPDLLYEGEIRELVQEYPLNLMMVETDGPWPFKGPFVEQQTRPRMIHHTIAEISRIKGIELDVVYKQIYLNSNEFYVVK
ncbi:MAG: TatD family hydrolase [Bacillota bacterium]